MGDLRHPFGPDGGRLRRPFGTELGTAEKWWQESHIFAGMLLKVLRVRGLRPPQAQKVLRVRGQHPPRPKKCSGFDGSVPQGGKSAQGSWAASPKTHKVVRVRGQHSPRPKKCSGFGTYVCRSQTCGTCNECEPFAPKWAGKAKRVDRLLKSGV